MFQSNDDGIVVLVPFVYILRCADGSFYVGHTNSLAGRERSHNEGRGSTHTVTRRPVQMVYAEEHATIKDAIAREHQLKCWSRKKKAALISGDPTGLKRSSKRIDATRHAQTFTWRDLLRHAEHRHGQG